MGSMAQTGLLLVPSDALGHTWALPGVLGGGRGLPPETGPRDLNVVQVFTPAHAVTVCYCCYCCSAASKQKMPKNPGKTRKYLGFPGYFRVLPALDAGDRRGSLPGLPYCCSAGLTLATVVGEPHCCSVVTVNTSNTVQLLTLNSALVVRTHRVRF